MNKVAKKIVEGINKTTNDYDAVEEVDKILRKHFVNKKNDRINQPKINRNSNQGNC
jgi:hypothetical protein